MAYGCWVLKGSEGDASISVDSVGPGACMTSGRYSLGGTGISCRDNRLDIVLNIVQMQGGNCVSGYIPSFLHILAIYLVRA